MIFTRLIKRQVGVASYYSLYLVSRGAYSTVYSHMTSKLHEQIFLNLMAYVEISGSTWNFILICRNILSTPSYKEWFHKTYQNLTITLIITKFTNVQCRHGQSELQYLSLRSSRIHCSSHWPSFEPLRPSPITKISSSRTSSPIIPIPPGSASPDM